MKTSSKIILENIRIDKQLRINVALVNDKQLNTLFNDINHHIDELNNTKMNEHEKISSYSSTTIQSFRSQIS